MKRVSTHMANRDVQYNLRTQESRFNKAQNQMGSQRRIQSLRDDPLAAGHLVRYQSYSNRLNTFEHNAQIITDNYSVSEGYVNQSLQLMHRIRELAVQGANGTYTPEDLKNMSTEVDELLKELVLNANATGPDGTSLFAGTRSNTTAFDIVYGSVEGSGDMLITSVNYNGNVESKNIEVDEGQYLETTASGSRIFWAEQQALYSMRDATSYIVPEDSVISVDGKQIKLKAGDNVYAIIAKINDSGAAVKANLDPITNGLTLRTTDARQLWLEDLNGGNTLNELGLIKDSSQRPPNNINPTANLSGGSLFDSVIALRNAMLVGDQEAIGGRVLGAIDQGISSLTGNLAESGAKFERAEQNLARISNEIVKVDGMISREGDLDITQAITDLKMLDYVQQATMSTAAKMYKNTLLDYVK
ncbi:MAG: flagellar hook-associated protein 3 [Spirochaetaceae bacterium]|nr:flagellar hook-associated protein 3 [Spirochaetaceae bacterium]MBR3814231.1 flagellar hook-associated protein 3 [Spirochaetaceae bacterium]MDD6486497.1 flagellar hook-associated protein 3 [Spirochaetales bacterium]